MSSPGVGSQQWVSVVMSLSDGDCLITNSAAVTALAVKPQYGPHRKHCFQKFSGTLPSKGSLVYEAPHSGQAVSSRVTIYDT
jgi:hypothetical protein